MNILKKLKLVLLIIGAIFSSYAVYAIEEMEEKKPVEGAKLSSENQKVPSSKLIGQDKARFLMVHKFPLKEYLIEIPAGKKPV
jgi:hypothetical protein